MDWKVIKKFICERLHCCNAFLFEKFCERMEAFAATPFLKSLQQQLQLFI